MKKSRDRKAKPSAATPAQISPEAGREYRATAEAALATATPKELQDLVLLFATYADGLAAKVFDRNACARQLLAWGKGHDQARLIYFGALEITNKILQRALSLSWITEFERREELLKLAADGLAQQIAPGCPEVIWPDESAFPANDGKPN